MALCHVGMTLQIARTISSMNTIEISLLAENMVFQYYYIMSQCPEKLHLFYRDESTMIFDSQCAHGQAEICSLLEKQHFLNARVIILKVDALKSHENSIMVQVSGELSVSGGPYRRFMQTLTLVELAPAIMFILVDILHFQDRIYAKETQQSVSISGKKSLNY